MNSHIPLKIVSDNARHFILEKEKCLFKTRIFILVFAVAIAMVPVFILLIFTLKVTEKYFRKRLCVRNTLVEQFLQMYPLSFRYKFPDHVKEILFLSNSM